MAFPFGFSNGDFITSLDKIYMVYKKIQSAPDVISDLSHHTESLQEVLEQVKGFLSGTDVPKDQQRLKALKRAFKGCTSIVDELNTFVDEYSGLAKKNKTRYFRLIKFITTDVNRLKSKLDSHTNLLCLSLSSLSNLSQVQVAESLEKMKKEYHAGKREPTVISQALDNKPVDQGELLEQIEKDLEDMDVHPAAIQHNLPFIQSWLERVLVEGGLDETGPEVSVDTPADGAGLLTKLQPEEEHVAFQEEQVDAKTETIELEDNHSHHDKWNGQPGADTALPLVNDDEDTQSVSSYQSKPDDWRPFDRPNFNYVQAMLSPFFKCNPYDIPQLEDCKHRFKRAFYQADWDGNGYLTRPEVVQLSVEALRRAGADDTDLIDQLQSIVTSFDSDHNKLFGLEEFSNLMLQLVHRSATVRRRQIADDLKSHGEAAEMLAQTRRQEEKKPMLPWGLSRNPSNAELPYYDEVLQVHIQSLPKRQLAPSSFSLMAVEAESCMASIETFEHTWLGICPKSLHTEILPTLNTVRELARKFTTLENPEDPTVLSDLDSALICYHLASHEFQERISHLKPEIHRLSEVRADAYGLLRQVQGFVYCLAGFEAADIKPVAQNFPLFWRKWRDNRIAFYSHHLALFNWIPVEQAVQAARAAVNAFAANSKAAATNSLDSNQLLVASEQLETGQDTAHTEDKPLEGWQCTDRYLRWHAVQSVQTVLEKKAKRKQELQSTSWTGKVKRIEIRGWHRSMFSIQNMFVAIEIDRPEQKFRTIGVPRGAGVQWNYLNLPIEIFPDSQIKLRVFYEEDGYPDRLKYTTIYSLSDEGVVAPDSYAAFKNRTNGLYDLIKEDFTVDHRLWLYIDMDNQNEIASEINILENMHWMTLLPKSIITTVSATPALKQRTQTADEENDFSSEETAVSLPPGWSKGRTRNGSVFFINSATGKSTFEDLEE